VRQTDTVGMNGRGFKACIFDFDGVIIHSEPLHAEASRRTLDYFGIAFRESIFPQYIGKPDALFFGDALARHGAATATVEELVEHKRLVYRELLQELPLADGVEPFVRSVRAHFGKLGLATSAIKNEVDTMHRIYGLRDWFDAIVEGEDTQVHKPDPEPYLRVLGALGTAGADTLAIEDSPAGVLSAHTAGCVTAGMTTSFAPAELRAAGADLVVGSFAELAQALGLPAPI
jgi:beta-phosphoglucomutase